MVKALFDTNILIDYLNARQEAREELARYTFKAISIITWMEVLVGVSDDIEHATRRFLNTFTVVPLDSDIAERAVGMRQRFRLRLPDAIIYATADVNSMLFVTRDQKDFQRGLPGIRVPYNSKLQ